MADLQTAMLNRIAADAELHDALNGRAFWNVVPQGVAKPYLRLLTVSDPRLRNINKARKPRRPRIQADVYAATYQQARDISEQLIELFTQSGEVGGVRFGGASASGPRDLGEDTPEGFLHRLSTDLLVENSVI